MHDEGRAGLSLLPRRIAQWEYDGKVRSVAMSSDGKYVGSDSEDRTARVREVAALAFSQGGKFLATATDNVARLWDAATGIEIARIIHDAGTQVR